MLETKSTNTSKGESRFAVGIDLGTTNCALAYCDRLKPEDGVRPMGITQWQSEDLVGEALVLPSFCYLVPKSDAKKRRFALPWHGDDEEPAEEVLGNLALQLAPLQHGRVIHSAKSWLCHRLVDRHERILPWNSDDVIGAKRRSPVEASALYLRHLKDCWNGTIAKSSDENRLENQEVTITVPASFDESAQRLTIEAAELAGFKPEKLRLLEEPQAAFYHFLDDIKKQGPIADQLAARLPALKDTAQNILICDIGGGTSDFSLFQVSPVPGNGGTPEIKRKAVSDHILLGGDNIDLQIAYHLEAKFLKKYGGELTASQAAYLANQSRNLKEQALKDGDLAGAAAEIFTVALPGASSHLFGSVKSAEITKGEIVAMICEGFYPLCTREASPTFEACSFQEWNLPFAQDCAITHHLAGFVRGHRVDAVLYTGGSLKPASIRKRLTALLESWQEHPVVEFANEQMDLAVALGSSAFTRMSWDAASTITGGYPRSLFVEVLQHGLPRLLCIMPKGFVGRDPLEITDLDLHLKVGEPVAFRLFSHRSFDALAGAIVEGNLPGLKSLPTLHTRLTRLQTPQGGRKVPSEDVRVGLRIHVESTGLLAVSCFDRESNDTWGLAFNLQDSPTSEQSQATPRTAPAEAARTGIAIAGDTFDICFGKKAVAKTNLAPGMMIEAMEKVLQSPRSEWDIATLRALWDRVREGMNRRARSLTHEAVWLNLAGYILRPGYGSDLDAYRMGELWPLFQQGPIHGDEARIKNQWWILWRRVAGGLTRTQQETVYAKVIPTLRKGNDATAEMYMLAGSLERVDMERKIQLGKILVEQICHGKHHCIDQKIWALGRLASRIPLYGGPESVIRPTYVESWLKELAKLDCRKAPLRRLRVVFSQGARLLENRQLDVGRTTRELALAKLSECQAPLELLQVVEAFVPQTIETKQQLFGESLPAGLYLGSD